MFFVIFCYYLLVFALVNIKESKKLNGISKLSISEFLVLTIITVIGISDWNK
jgi:hypothetical protein